MQGFGLELVAIQALLFSRRDLGLFREAAIEEETVEFLKGLCGLASDLGARVLVFGSPSNRVRGKILMDEAFDRASRFFSMIAPTANDQGVCVCIEPLRADETDFITTAAEGIRLVEMVGHPGFGLHLDSKAVAAEGQDLNKIFRLSEPYLKHFHISEPQLREIGSTGEVDHTLMARTLRDIDYQGYVSIEMRTWSDPSKVVERSLRLAKDAYLSTTMIQQR